MKIQNTILAIFLACFVVFNGMFVTRYIVKTDFSWPVEIFPNYFHAPAADINASLILEPGSSHYTYSLDIPGNSTAANLLITANQKYNIGLVTKDFKGAGLFVESLMGKNSDTNNNTYWFFYVNDQSSQVGISQYKVKDGDKISFRYEKSQF